MQATSHTAGASQCPSAVHRPCRQLCCSQSAAAHCLQLCAPGPLTDGQAALRRRAGRAYVTHKQLTCASRLPAWPLCCLLHLLLAHVLLQGLACVPAKWRASLVDHLLQGSAFGTPQTRLHQCTKQLLPRTFASTLKNDGMQPSVDMADCASPRVARTVWAKAAGEAADLQPAAPAEAP